MLGAPFRHLIFLITPGGTGGGALFRSGGGGEVQLVLLGSVVVGTDVQLG